MKIETLDGARITKPGAYLMAAETYFADPCPEPSLTQSIAKVLIDHSPLHAKQEHPRLTPPEEQDGEKYDKAKAIGNAAHLLMLGRGKSLAIFEADSWRMKDAQSFRDKAFEGGREPILVEHYEEAARIVKAARDQIDAVQWHDAFQDGAGEVVLAWEESGVWFRTMIDWITPDFRTIYDYKTGGQSFAPHMVGGKAVNDGWEIQAAMQERGLNRLDPKGAGRRLHRFIGQENWKPYALLNIELTEYHLTMGRKKLDVAIDLWRMCITANKWPGYPARVVRPEYPPYAETAWLAREVDYAEAGIGNGTEARFAAEELYKPAEV